MYVRKTIHFLLFLIGGKKIIIYLLPDWRKNNAVSHPPATGQGRKKVRTNKRISLHSDAVDAEKKKYA